MGKGCMITAHRLHHIAPEHHRRVAQQQLLGINSHQKLLMGFRKRRGVDWPGIAMLVDIFAARTNDGIVGMCRQKHQLAHKAVWQADIVGIHAGDQRRTRFRNQLV